MELKRPIRTVLQVAILAAAAVVPGAVTAQTGALEPPIDVEAPLHEPAWPNPLEPIVIGPKDEVGQQSLGEKAAKGLLGSLLGGSRGDSRPKTLRDPSRRIDYVALRKPAADIEVGARAMWEDDGLLVSSRIEDHGEKGSFHAIFLEDCTGRRLYPASIEIYKIWSEHSISVSWSKTSTVDGRVVGSESGSWSDSWSGEWGLPGIEDDTAVEGPPGIWQQMGYDRAHGGVRQLGAKFAVTPGELPPDGLALLVHVSRPEMDPVITEAMPFVIEERAGEPMTSAAGDDPGTDGLNEWRESCVAGSDPGGSIAGQASPPPGESDRSTSARTVTGAAATVAGSPPCIEALLAVEEKKTAFLTNLNDPQQLLAAALAAANQLGEMTRREAEAQANLAAEQALLENLQSHLQAWDQWFNEKIEQREQRRLERYGSKEPSWARGSRARAEKRHEEDSAQLRRQVAEQQAEVEQAQQAASTASQARQAAQNRFDRALEDFRRALMALRNAKDQFADVVIRHYRCSPCEVIADHWSSAARLQALLDRLAAMLAQAQARVSAQLPQARQQAAEAEQAAQQAGGELAGLEQRSSQIEQELRDAVDTDSGCLSLEPKEGWGWMNLASMDNTRGSIVPEGAAMAWRSRFKGLDVRIWAKPGCLQEKIEDIDWNRVNELNAELHDLQEELAEAEAQAAQARREAGLAQAVVAGLEAERDALRELEQALRASGIEENTEAVLNRLDELSEDCAQAMKDAIRGAADARRRHGDANGRTAAGIAREDAARRRAGAAADALDDIDPSTGTDEDQSKHDDLSGRADDLAGEGDGEPATPPPVHTPPPPETVEEAEEQRRKAEDDASEAEDVADQVQGEADALEDEVSELEDEVDALGDRLADWRRYHAAVAAYKDCLRKKKEALEELAELDQESASALQELADMIDEAAKGLSSAASDVGSLGRVNKKARDAAKKAGDIAKKLERISNAMEVIDAVMRADDLRPSEKLEAMSKAFEELREWLPELPGVTEMLKFYNEAMKAIAGKLAEIEDQMIKQWTDLVEAGLADPEDAPLGIREEVRKAARIRELLKIISRNCGKPPLPPASVVAE